MIKSRQMQHIGRILIFFLFLLKAWVCLQCFCFAAHLSVPQNFHGCIKRRPFCLSLIREMKVNPLNSIKPATLSSESHIMRWDNERSFNENASLSSTSHQSMLKQDPATYRGKRRLSWPIRKAVATLENSSNVSRDKYAVISIPLEVGIHPAIFNTLSRIQDIVSRFERLIVQSTTLFGTCIALGLVLPKLYTLTDENYSRSRVKRDFLVLFFWKEAM
ncbi:hypothetical protein IE077_002618 [Cardiosporidium cionae]|uniref:Uncharacterized protein n=1 Tax=Cardiosporidium cionae TaxID=476202 RepID=A0ABQ7JAG2_9APIC|nr:hypothetical protein IE077_002618 [Cardiosporidium cionae]|eukprot:KAF8820954.1 hypothetical protein IE077_002618 [Cardiosporidium cionae]